MAFVDRVLTIKLATDVGDINAKLDGTGSRMGALAGQVAGFAKATAIGLALQGIDEAINRFSGGIEDARAYRNTLIGVNLAFQNVGVGADEAAERLDALNARSLDLGFDDVATLEAYQGFIDLTGDADAAVGLLEATFDRARAEQKDLATAANETTRLYRGGTRQLELFGLSVDEYGTKAASGMDRVEAALGRYDTAAEDFAASSEGMQERIGTMADRGFATLGEEVLKLSDELLPVLMDDVLPALGDAFTTVQPFLQSVGESLGTVAGSAIELWDAAEPLRDALAPVVELLGEAFITALETIDGLLAALAQLLRGDLSGAFRTVADTVTNVFEPIAEVIRDVVNSVIDVLNSVSFGGITILSPSSSSPTRRMGPCSTRSVSRTSSWAAAIGTSSPRSASTFPNWPRAVSSRPPRSP